MRSALVKKLLNKKLNYLKSKGEANLEWYLNLNSKLHQKCIKASHKYSNKSVAKEIQVDLSFI